MTAHAAARATERRQVRVLVVDDNPGFRDSLVSLLDTDELTVVGQASSGAEAIELATLTLPDVILMDVRMPGMNGIETTRLLKEAHPSVGIVALTGFEDQWAVRDMLVAGASGYVLKDSDGDEILHAVRQAASGGGVISPEVTPGVIEELTESLERERLRTRQLEMAQEALLERAARRHELIARLGHELRTPVTVILGMAQVLAGGRPRSISSKRSSRRSSTAPRLCPAWFSDSRRWWRPGLRSGQTLTRPPARSRRPSLGWRWKPPRCRPWPTSTAPPLVGSSRSWRRTRSLSPPTTRR